MLETLVAMRKRHAGIQEIAEALGIKRQFVYNKLKNMNRPDLPVLYSKRPRKSSEAAKPIIYQKPEDSEIITRGDVILEIIKKVDAGKNIFDMAQVYNMPMQEIGESIARRDAIIRFEKNVSALRVFAPQFSVPAYKTYRNGNTCRLTPQQIIDFLRLNSIKVFVNDVDGQFYVDGVPVSKQTLIFMANEIRRRNNLPDFGMKREQPAQRGVSCD